MAIWDIGRACVAAGKGRAAEMHSLTADLFSVRSSPNAGSFPSRRILKSHRRVISRAANRDQSMSIFDAKVRMRVSLMLFVCRDSISPNVKDEPRRELARLGQHRSFQKRRPP